MVSSNQTLRALSKHLEGILTTPSFTLTDDSSTKMEWRLK